MSEIVDMVTVATRSEAETHELGRRLAALLSGGETLGLIGELGAGKTALTRGIGVGLGAGSNVVSPTFTLLRQVQGRLLLLHFDLYRLESLWDAEDLLRENAPGPDELAVVEWADRFPGLFHDADLMIHIAYGEGDARTVEIRSRRLRLDALK